MENLQKKFIVEANEFINNLEDSLLSLEKNPGDKNKIQEIFRIMHSLKGSGAMFGFDDISEFTHNLENIYDLIRNNEMVVTKELLNVTLASVDHLRNLLNQNSSEEVKKEHQRLTNIINDIINIKNKEEKKDIEIASEKKQASIPEQDVKNQDIKTYFIFFEPKEDIFSNGTNPLYLLDELNSMGTCKVFSRLNKIPSIEDISIEKCYTYWDVILSTSQGINAISDVFIFVEDDCNLEILEIAAYDLFENNFFIKEIENKKFLEKNISIDELRKFISTLSNIEVEPEENDISAPDKISESIEDIVDEVKQTKIVTPQSKEKALSTIRVSSEKLDQLMNLVSELVTTQARLLLFAEESKDNELIAIAENIQKLSRQLRENAFDMCLTPIQTMLTRFKRLVRDLSNELNKDVEFITEGAETELDKTIIENIADPIMHILRNSIDHGIESEETRVRLGKPKQGKILLKAFYSGTNVHIMINDDGAGIDPEKIKEKALKIGIINPETSYSKKELLNLILISGFSTSKNVTDVSGRGVGMDVVKRNIEEVRGEVEIDSVVNKGTTITIKLPLTLSIIDGLLVKINNTCFIIPLSAVDKIYEADRSVLENNFNNIIVFESKQIPFLYLRHEFDITDNCPSKQNLVVVNYDDKQMGLAVDTVVGEYQAVLKPLGKYLNKNEIFSGASILGDGTVALVMDTNKVINKFTN